MEETKVNLRAIVDRLHQMQVVHKWWILIGVQDPKMTWPTQTEKKIKYAITFILNTACVDAWDDGYCESYDDMCNSNEEFREHCKKTCGLCSDNQGKDNKQSFILKKTFHSWDLRDFLINSVTCGFASLSAHPLQTFILRCSVFVTCDRSTYKCNYHMCFIKEYFYFVKFKKKLKIKRKKLHVQK